jgi:hypothetical protein
MDNLQRSFGKTEIGNFSDSIFQKYISDFDVTVDYMLFGEVSQSLIDVTDYSLAVAFFEHSSGLHNLRFQVTLIANFCDNVAIIGGTDYVIAA